LAEWLRAHWSEWQFGATPDEVSLLLLTGGQRSINKVVALAFTGQDSQPCLVVKMPRVTDAVPGLQREAAILKTLQARRTTPLPGVPRIIFSEEHKSSFMLGETALTGVPLFTQLDRRNYRTWAFKATDWLIALAAAPQAISRDNWWSRLVEPILNDFQRSFAAIVDRHMLQETHLILMQLDSLPLVCEQRDFSPWNVLITATGELVVLDWESAVLDGLPGLDLIYFLTYLTFFVSGAMKAGAFVKAYRAGWSEQTLLGQVNAACLQHYCAALKLDEACLSALRPLTWLLHSRSEYARLTADASGAPLTETLRQSVFVQLWEEEMRRAKMKQGSSI
jgi:aminoglycoside phosphotransferase (APT) family kinase protein